MLSEKQFKLLRFLLIHKDENFTQRQLAEQLDLSLGTVNALVGKLKEEKWIDEEHHLNELGKNVLEPYRVENAIIMAAGMSSRFAPLSYEIPKGLLQVKGGTLDREANQTTARSRNRRYNRYCRLSTRKNVLSGRKVWR